MHDVVYILKNGVKPDELRYSLRSLENFPHGKVWFFGDCPAGIEPDVFVRFRQRGTNKWQKATSTYRAICCNKEVSEDFWMFNDDFFILKPMDTIPYMYHGTLAERVEEIRHRYGYSRYARNLDGTGSVLEAKGKSTLNYALHVPMLFNKWRVLEVLSEYPNYPMFRSLYGNHFAVGGIDTEDVKIYDTESIPSEEQMLLSTSDESFSHGKAGDYIRNKFKTQSKWEIQNET